MAWSSTGSGVGSGSAFPPSEWQSSRVYTRSQLLDLVWGYGFEGLEHTVNSHINRLRGKLGRDLDHPDYIETVWGVGYRFVDPAKAPPK